MISFIRKSFLTLVSFIFIELGLDFKNMPPCKSVLVNKIARVDYLTRILKSPCESIIGAPDSGWQTNDGKLEIRYFSGSPYPESIADMTCSDDSDNDEEFQLSSGDEEESDHDSSDDDWSVKK